MDIRTIASGSTGNCYYISGNSPILLDCGIAFPEIQKALNYKVSELVGCFLSHSHGDHSRSIKKMMQAGIDCYVSQESASELSLSGHRAKIVEPLKPFQVGEWTCLAFPLEHDVYNLGYLLANKHGMKLAYITDTFYCRYKFPGCTHLLIEANHSYEILDQRVASGSLPEAQRKRLMQSHFSLENVKKFLLANDLSRVHEIWLLHLSSGNSNAEQFKREIQSTCGIPTYIAGE
jgi:phosphoribosyl 1,2-cyclic phosphodiesterase